MRQFSVDVEGEDAALEVERIALPHHALRPFAAGLRRRLAPGVGFCRLVARRFCHEKLPERMPARQTHGSLQSFPNRSRPSWCPTARRLESRRNKGKSMRALQ